LAIIQQRASRLATSARSSDPAGRLRIEGEAEIELVSAVGNGNSALVVDYVQKIPVVPEPTNAAERIHRGLTLAVTAGDIRARNSPISWTTWIITANGASLSRDLAQRCITLHLRRPEYEGGWEAKVDRYIDDYLPGIQADIAAAFAESGKQVLVFDCDFRRPSMTRLLWPDHDRSVASVVADGGEVTLQKVVSTTLVPNVRLVRVAGHSSAAVNPSILLAELRGLIEQARDQSDVILLDTAPVMAVNDATDLLPEVDLVVMAVRSGLTPRDEAVRAHELLSRLRARVIGAVLIGVATARSYAPYYNYADVISSGESEPGRALTGLPSTGEPTERE
jgi:hypothetical protein